MTRYDIRLRIAYHYPGHVKDARHILRVTPREIGGQRLERASLEIDPVPAELASEPDFFGNACEHLLIHQPHDELAIELKVRLAVERPAPDLGMTPSVAAISALAAAARDPGGDSPIHFLGGGRLVAPSPEIGAYLRETLAPDAPVAEAMLALARRIKAEFRFQSGVSTITTTVAETFEQRRGVCQDFSHLMIAGLRACGLPARYASGFLRTEPPPGRPRLEGADAMHAWVEVWTGEDVGWMGFDPTNGCLASEDHVLVAVGRDYGDVAPIDGVLITSGPQKHRHSVDMVEVVDPR
ncbi:transglutaminase family protein [Aureimonas pseudogalii]|uniref:Transglutaminase-like putative cysteine protease n=1 Tax=Aureimonas pseudogalii TaxID=1744844 RepID=A0A7W6E9R4_9HYPH|nr:transglutaminase family protein [Aureimonas pseudogalii]MBB3997345.1 transglutaminase-like putative cysteine protease [Aureimonas pseudogalii]